MYVAIELYISMSIVSVLAWRVVDGRVEPRSGQTKENAIGSCAFTAKHEATMRKSKDRWLEIMCPSETTCLPTDC